jgi:uncharacterized protein (TIGR00661 family)
MIFSQKDNITSKLTILIAPLDWGLGHATRCIPIIKLLQSQNHHIIIAAEKNTQTLLQQAFTNIECIHLHGYRISYAKSKWTTIVKLLYQIPSIILAIYKEHKWLKKVVKKYKIDLVIADNRYGLYHTQIPTVFITHQLLIKTGHFFTDNLLQKINYYFIKKFTQCWVPDVEGEKNIAGALAHPKKIPNNIYYIGLLSRIEKITTTKKIYSILVLLSGPEPQRTIFETILLNQLKDSTQPILFVRGLPTWQHTIQANPQQNIEVKNYLPTAELSLAIAQASIVICRSGYSTIMDLIAAQAQAILVPTPGQTEQQYLANYLQQQGYFYSSQQQNFNIKKAVQASSSGHYSTPDVDVAYYILAVKNCIQKILLEKT